MRKSLWAVLAVVVAGVLGLVALRAGEPRRGGVASGQAVLGSRSPTAPPRNRPRSLDPQIASLGPTSGLAIRPASQRGTEIDGALVVDASGRFVPTRDALELFEYFFVARGEEPDDVIVERIDAEIRRRLDPRARPAALAFLGRYLDYRHRARALAETGRAESLAQIFDALVEMRREVFGDHAEALFGADETRTRVALAQREIARDSSLPVEERRELIDALYAELPESERVARERATAPARLLREEADLRAAGAGASDLRAHRADLFGVDAAERLAALDRHRAAWDARLVSFRSARDLALSDPALSPREQLAAVRSLLEERFTGPERLRVEALERTEAAEAAS